MSNPLLHTEGQHDGQDATTRHLLARLDQSIIDLDRQQQEIAAERTWLAALSDELETTKARLMDVRAGLRPILDSSAPKEFPYDKR